jgi:hypothetical protein
MYFNPEIALHVDLAAALIALVALVISVMVSRHQSRVALENLRLQRDSDIIKWSNRAVDHLCSAEMILRPEYHLFTAESAYEKARLELMRDLSSCIDQGRLFFPNLRVDKQGQDKQGAYQGYRHPVLDCLVATYRVLEHNDVRREDSAAFETDRSNVTDFKRLFISRLDAELDPRGIIRFLKDQLGHKGKVAKLKNP